MKTLILVLRGALSILLIPFTRFPRTVGCMAGPFVVAWALVHIPMFSGAFWGFFLLLCGIVCPFGLIGDTAAMIREQKERGLRMQDEARHEAAMAHAARTRRRTTVNVDARQVHFHGNRSGDGHADEARTVILGLQEDHHGQE